MKFKPNCRVLMLLENNPYPSDLRVRQEANSLVSHGFQVTVIAPGTRSQSSYENIHGVHVYRYPEPPAGEGCLSYLVEYSWALFFSFFLTFWVFFRRGFDVIHAHNPPDLFVLIAMCFRVIGKKFIFDHHDLSPEMYYARFDNQGSRFVFQALKFFEILSCRMAHQVIATNESYKKVEMERAGIPASRVSIVRNGPDISKMKPVEPEPTVRAKATVNLGYLGVIGQQDGVDYLIRSLEYIVKELGITDIHAIIMGSGSAVPSLKKLTAQLELEQYISFTGSIPYNDLPRYVSACDICVDPDPHNPYNDRSTMVKMMDYMAMAKPIVAFDLTEHRASAGPAALYSIRNDVHDLAKTIVELIANPNLQNKMGETGRQRMIEQFAWHHQENQLLKAYANIGFNAPAQTSPTNSMPPKTASPTELVSK